MTFKSSIKQINDAIKEHIDSIDDMLQTHLKEVAIKMTVDSINSNLFQKLPGFVILGQTPYFNDGEECTHYVMYGLPHLEYQDTRPKYIYDQVFDNPDIFKRFYGALGVNIPDQISDAFDFCSEIETGICEEYLYIEEGDTKENIISCLKGLNKLLEYTQGTNYLLMVVLKDDEYEITLDKFEPSY